MYIDIYSQLLDDVAHEPLHVLWWLRELRVRGPVEKGKKETQRHSWSLCV